MVGSAVVSAVARGSCWAAVAAASALACISHARYGTWAATYSSAVGPCQAPACTPPSTVASSSAVSVYSVLNALHAPAAANSEPGPGPALSSAECTSGGAAIQIGAVIASPSCAPGAD